MTWVHLTRRVVQGSIDAGMQLFRKLWARAGVEPAAGVRLVHPERWSRRPLTSVDRVSPSAPPHPFQLLAHSVLSGSSRIKDRFPPQRPELIRLSAHCPPLFKAAISWPWTKRVARYTY
jgi:hypothetical protein